MFNDHRKNSKIVNLLNLVNFYHHAIIKSPKRIEDTKDKDFRPTALSSGSTVSSTPLAINTLKSCFLFLFVILYLIRQMDPPSL